MYPDVVGRLPFLSSRTQRRISPERFLPRHGGLGMTAQLTMQGWRKWSWQGFVRLGKIAGALTLASSKRYSSDVR